MQAWAYEHKSIHCIFQHDAGKSLLSRIDTEIRNIYTEFDLSQGNDVKIEPTFLIIETDVQFFNGNGHICYLKCLN